MPAALQEAKNASGFAVIFEKAAEFGFGIFVRRVANYLGFYLLFERPYMRRVVGAFRVVYVGLWVTAMRCGMRSRRRGRWSRMRISCPSLRRRTNCALSARPSWRTRAQSAISILPYSENTGTGAVEAGTDLLAGKMRAI